MSTTALNPSSANWGRPYRWSCDEFHQLGDEGWFEGRHVILVNGEILDMPVPNPPHDTSVGLADYRFKQIFPPPAYWVRIQTGLVVGADTDLAPDVAVVPGTPRDYIQHPRTALLVVEVSESSLAYDLGEKSNLYAAAGIADYWVVDLVHRQLHVFRDPQPDPAQPHGHAYQQHQAFGPTDAVAPLAATGSPVTVADLLP